MGTTASLLQRGISRGIDIILVLAVAVALPKVGWLAGFLYIILADGLMGGSSVGKKLLELRVIRRDGAPCTFTESAFRNSTFALGFLLWSIPYIGWLLFGTAVAMEFIILFGSRESARLGDELAQTMVMDMAEHQGDRSFWSILDTTVGNIKRAARTRRPAGPMDTAPSQQPVPEDAQGQTEDTEGKPEHTANTSENENIETDKNRTEGDKNSV